MEFVKAWYPGLDLDRLAAFRSEAQAELEAVEGALVERAAAIADYTDTSVFVPERAEGGEEVPPEWFGMNPEYGEDSAEVIDSSTEEEDGDVSAMQGFRGLVERWGGRGSCGGASELLGGARGGRSQWLRRTAATVIFGRERERAREKRGRVSESRGDRDGLRTSSTRPGGRRQAGGGRAAARASTQQLRGVGRKTTGSYSVGLGRLLAGPASWLGRTGKSSLSFLFSVLFNISATLLN